MTVHVGFRSGRTRSVTCDLGLFNLRENGEALRLVGIVPSDTTCEGIGQEGSACFWDPFGGSTRLALYRNLLTGGLDTLSIIDYSSDYSSFLARRLGRHDVSSSADYLAISRTIADKLAVDASVVHRWLRGRRLPSIDTTLRFIGVLIALHIVDNLSDCHSILRWNGFQVDRRQSVWFAIARDTVTYRS